MRKIVKYCTAIIGSMCLCIEIESVLYMYFKILVDRIQSSSKSRQPVMKLHVGRAPTH